MTDKKSTWKPEDEEALKALIRETIKAAGPAAPGALPSKIKARIKGRATGDLDVDAYIREVLAETKHAAKVTAARLRVDERGQAHVVDAESSAHQQPVPTSAENERAAS